jgi:curved DNA-binding protein CbpA
MASLLGEEDEQHTSYYSVLNVSKDASQDEVRKAYRTLANVFHPDKHRDEGVKDQAQQAFSRLQEAYEVLSDPERRQVYDVYGKQGLDAGAADATGRWQRKPRPCAVRTRHAPCTPPAHEHTLSAQACRWAASLRARRSCARSGRTSRSAWSARGPRR